MLDLFFVISFWQRFTSCKHISKYPIAAEQKKKKKEEERKATQRYTCSKPAFLRQDSCDSIAGFSI